jgi:hypothetical protein
MLTGAGGGDSVSWLAGGTSLGGCGESNALVARLGFFIGVFLEGVAMPKGLPDPLIWLT